jgi:hypothetical protein
MGISTVTKSREWQTTLVIVKNILITFKCDGVVHHKFVPLVRTVNQQYYTHMLWYLWESNLRNREKEIGRFIMKIHPPYLSKSSWTRTKWLQSQSSLTLWTLLPENSFKN